MLNVDLAACLVSGIALGVTSILVSSMLPDMSPPPGDGDTTAGAEGPLKDGAEGSLKDGAECPLKDGAEKFTQTEVDAFVQERLCARLIDKVPPSLMGPDEIREAVAAAAAMKDESTLMDEDVNIFVILSWLLFLCVLVVSYYMLDLLSSGEVSQVLKGFFPREFAFVSQSTDRLRAAILEHT